MAPLYNPVHRPFTCNPFTLHLHPSPFTFTLHLHPSPFTFTLASVVWKVSPHGDSVFFSANTADTLSLLFETLWI